MKLSQFKYDLPEELIAQHPTTFRDECRLMVVHAKRGIIEHREKFTDILDYFGADDVMVFNDTKVFPARLDGKKEKTGASIEVFLLRELNPELRLWDVLVSPARKIRIGNKLYFGGDYSMVAEVIDNTTSRGRTLRFLYDGTHEQFRQDLFRLGTAPLPPSIIKRDVEPSDMEDFQTLFAKHEGAVTAPTAGLHFSKQLLTRLELADVRSAFVTLHCGLGNFREIDVEDLTKFKTDSEEMHIEQPACDIVNKAKMQGKRVCAVGTTVQRVLETSVSADGMVKPYGGWTSKFIFPPYDFHVADAMVVNFHMPQSPMLMLTCAYGGYNRIMRAYNEAVVSKYRFGTYGDAMLILQD